MKKANFSFTTIKSVENYRNKINTKSKNLALNKEDAIKKNNALCDELVKRVKRDGIAKVYKQGIYIELIK